MPGVVVTRRSWACARRSGVTGGASGGLLTDVIAAPVTPGPATGTDTPLPRSFHQPGRMAQPRPRPAVRRTFCRSSGTAHYRKKGMTKPRPSTDAGPGAAA